MLAKLIALNTFGVGAPAYLVKWGHIIHYHVNLLSQSL
jgi:hypothetical protein